MNIANLLVRLVLILTIATHCVSARELDRIIAVVDNDVVMLSELEAQMRRVASQMRESNVPIPPQSVLENQVTERLILNKIQLQRAQLAGIEVSDSALNQTIGRIAQENGLEIPEFRSILEQDGYNFNSFREDIRDEMTIAALRQQQVDARAVVTEREIDDYLNTQQQQEQAVEYRLSHILLAIPEGASDDRIAAVQERAERVLQRLRDGADFAETAISASDGQNAFQGGDLGWRKGDEVPSLFADTVSAMEKGDISELIRSGSGYHIIQLSDLRSGETVMIEQTRARHILIKIDELTSEEDAEDRLAQLKLRLEAGDDFAELARTQSDDRASAVEGGDLGWNSPGALVPEFEQVMDALAPGDISEPFKSRFGWHIIQVLERRDHDSTEAIRRNQVRQAIRKRKIDEEYQVWVRRLRDEAYVEYRE